MSITALELPSQALKKYRPGEAIQRRKSAKGPELSKRRHRASLTARKAADLLYSEFGAKKVFVFGSLARRGGFTPWSDIDIAVRGISPSRFFEAVGVVTGFSAEFRIDLVDLQTSPAAIRKAVDTEGKVL